MKAHLILIVLLVLGGGILGYKYFQEHQESKTNHYKEVIFLLNKSLEIDNNLNTITLQSRYNLAGQTKQLQVLIEDLRDKLAKILEAEEKSPNPSRKVKSELDDYETILSDKKAMLDTLLVRSASIKETLSKTTDSGIDIISSMENKAENLELISSIASVNNGLFEWALYGDNDRISRTERMIEKLMDLANEQKMDDLLQFAFDTKDAIDQQKKVQASIDAMLAAPINKAIAGLTSYYREKSTLIDEKLEKSRLYTMAYAVVAALIALYLIIMLMRSYSRLESTVEERTGEISNAYEKLKESQEQLIQSEKMASLGQMVAGIAHEINTPLGYVSNNVSIIKENVEYLEKLLAILAQMHVEVTIKPQDINKIKALLNQCLKVYRKIKEDDIAKESHQLLDDSVHGLAEIAELVTSLKDFSRLDRQVAEYYNLHDGLNSALKISANTLRKNNVVVHKNFSDIPEVQCMPSKINQVFLNIITNAAQAMPENGGKIVISTHTSQDSVIVEIKDTGKGMSEDVRSKIFDPFYTTKPIGEGSGLGMSISYKIIENHHGTIDVKSKVNKGTSMVIRLPIKQPTDE